MGGSRISIGLHDGARMVARKPIDRKLRDRNLLDVTKSAFDTKTSQHSLGEMVQEIAGVKANNDSGFQVYLALEKDGKVMQVGLPCVSGKEGQKHFLDATNMKAGDIDSMLGHLPEDVELMVVWRLDQGMTQDIVVTESSIMSPIADSVDYSALDRKACIGCGGGIDEKLNLVFDILQVEIFGGEKDDPIRMSTMMAAPPTSHDWDVIPIEPQFIQQTIPKDPRVDVMDANRPLMEQTDFSVRTSWTDSIELPEAPQPLITDPLLEDSQKPVEKEKPQVIMLIVYSEKRTDPEPTQLRRGEPPAHFRPSEKRLWRQIHSAPVAAARITPAIPLTQPRTPSLRPSPKSPQPIQKRSIPKPRLNQMKKTADPKPITHKTKAKKSKKTTPKSKTRPKKKAKPRPKTLPKAKKKRPPKINLKRKKNRPKKSFPKTRPKIKPRKPDLRSAKETLAKKKLAPETISKKRKTEKPKPKGKPLKIKRIRSKARKAAKRTKPLRKKAKKRPPIGKSRKKSKKKKYYLKELLGYPSTKKKKPTNQSGTRYVS